MVDLAYNFHSKTFKLWILVITSKVSRYHSINPLVQYRLITLFKVYCKAYQHTVAHFQSTDQILDRLSPTARTEKHGQIHKHRLSILQLLSPWFC